MTMCVAQIQGRAGLQNTAHKRVTVLPMPQQALWPMHINQRQTPSNFQGDYHRSYGLGASTHSTALNSNTLPRGFQSLSALISEYAASTEE